MKSFEDWDERPSKCRDCEHYFEEVNDAGLCKDCEEEY